MTELLLRKVDLNDKYKKKEGSVFLSGTQALVRLSLMQHDRDRARGLKTAGFVTGYRGSPLGAVDQAFQRASKLTQAADITFHPGVNEDLAATSVWGTQQVGTFGTSPWDGVFSMWYAKGPGVHRSGDVFLHANLAGTSKNGGVLALAGDDHTCKSSTNAHQSEFSFIDAMMPVLNPANVRDIVEFGLFGWEMSRYSGCWTGMKLIAETVETSGVLLSEPEAYRYRKPTDFEMPEAGLHLRWPDTALDQEQRLHELKLPAAQAFARANGIDKIIMQSDEKRFGLITTGKSYLDTLEALKILGHDLESAAKNGLSIYKVGMVWPLDEKSATAFCDGLEDVLIIEEKRSILEPQLKNALFNHPADRRPNVIGRQGQSGHASLPSYSELSPRMIANHLANFLPDFSRASAAIEPTRTIKVSNLDSDTKRTPYFCSGCPHNSSTKVPDGSSAFAGIGCHYMVLWMDRKTEGFTHMGGEGANWIGLAPYSDTKHMFQNMGDGTYFHSGYLAIRAAVAANVNMTYKILFNDAVAMTGGQPFDGELSPLKICHQLVGEGIKRITLVSENHRGYANQSSLPSGVTFHDRTEMDRVQKELREVKGVSAIVYDQTCAAELRRRRKKKIAPDPKKRIFINDAVCEGCGDCSVQSNCLSVIPKSTELGVKRQIDQSSCNKDYSCFDGFCPSFVTLEGEEFVGSNVASKSAASHQQISEPTPAGLENPYSVLVTGVGGTGVVTIGALLTMAAHIEGKGCTALDMAGLAQKGGPVTSHLKFAQTQSALSTSRISDGDADLLLGCDMVVAGNDDVLRLTTAETSKVVVNATATNTADFVLNRDFVLPTQGIKQKIKGHVVPGAFSEVDATGFARAFLGEAIGANLFLLGVAFQKGYLPVGSAALEQAIRLNGVAIDMNLEAFRLGRTWVEHPGDLIKSLPKDSSLELSIDQKQSYRSFLLVDYQDAKYSALFDAMCERARAAEEQVAPNDDRLLKAVIENAYRLMAYKDEYEVARLTADSEFIRSLRANFKGKTKLRLNLAPPLISQSKDQFGRPKKISFGAWMIPFMQILASGKFARGHWFDPFGWTHERRSERQYRDTYLSDLETWLPNLSSENYELVCEIAELPKGVCGFGVVKESSMQIAKDRREEILSKLRS